jgi:hypothetical protein
MGIGVEEGTKLLDDMQNNHSQWHVERSSRKAKSITETKNEELVAKVNELLGIVKHYAKKSYSRDVTGSKKIKIVTDNRYT